MKTKLTLTALAAGALLAGPSAVHAQEQLEYRYGDFGSCSQRDGKKRVKGWKQYRGSDGKLLGCVTTAPRGETYGLIGSCSQRITVRVNGKKRTKRVKGVKVYQDGRWVGRRCALQ